MQVCVAKSMESNRNVRMMRERINKVVKWRSIETLFIIEQDR